MSINKEYVPDSLTAKDKVKQINSIKSGTDRPKLKSATTKRSSHVVKFEKKYGYKINELGKIYKNIISKTGTDKIIEKGMGAYYSSGSRPNVSARSWAYSRLASVIMNGGARKVDKDIWDKYKV